jgi:hypothetical protein
MVQKFSITVPKVVLDEPAVPDGAGIIKASPGAGRLVFPLLTVDE